MKAKSMAMQGQQNRYCVIKERAIFYYKSSNLKDLKEPKGAIPLSTHKLIAHGQQQNAFWVFELQVFLITSYTLSIARFFFCNVAHR